MKSILSFAVSLGTALLAIGLPCPAAAPVTVLTDLDTPQVAFARQDLVSALQKRNHAVALQALSALPRTTARTIVVLSHAASPALRAALQSHGVALPDNLPAEGFSIRVSAADGKKFFWVVGGDDAGAMYGGLELAEVILTGGLDAVQNDDQQPYMPLRGIKFNCPLDERTPTYHAHTGDSQQKNVLVMWDMDFWKAYIDALARDRYNYLSLWNLHPFPSMVRVPGYEKVALDDVHSTTKTLRMSMDEKIEFWRSVMRYAKSRNVDVYIVTWNIFVLGTDGKYGLTVKYDNPTTTDYFRKSVKQLLLTYPDLAGVGLTTGENMPKMTTRQKETWAYETYGKAVLEVARQQPQRTITFLHRQHQTGARDIAKRFQTLVDCPNVNFIFSFKYAKAHALSSTRQPFCNAFVNDIAGMKTIWTLRNDSNYYFRWGAPDFVRQFIRNIPYDVSAGYYYGADGYVWGREFLSKIPLSPRALEMSKHWYHWLLWGRLGYDPDLDNGRIIKILGARYPDVPAQQLFNAWQAASMVYPITTGFHWGALDFQWYIEGCVSKPGPAETKSGFHDVNRFITLGTHPGTDNVPIPKFVEATAAGRSLRGTTPLQIADQLRDSADRALRILELMPAVSTRELRLTLADIRAMALLGKYYEHKIRGATDLALYRRIGAASQQQAAVRELTAATSYWEQYIRLAQQYYVNPIRLNRVGDIDWQALTAEVKKDVEIARAAKPAVSAQRYSYSIPPSLQAAGATRRDP